MGWVKRDFMSDFYESDPVLAQSHQTVSGKSGVQMWLQVCQTEGLAPSTVSYVTSIFSLELMF